MKEGQETEIMSSVVQSPAMQAPPKNKMLEYHNDPIQKNPPQVHSRIWQREDGSYAISYNGVDLLTFEFLNDAAPILRFHSDGDFQSEPFIQQFQIWSSTEAKLRVTVSAPVEWWNVRPSRAEKGQSIIGQLGRPLLYGVNGIYLPDWDLLVSLHGVPFSWEQKKVQKQNGSYTASLTAQMDEYPWVILIRPHYFSEHLGYKNHEPWNRRPKADTICGWCSWEAYHSDVTLENVAETSKALEPLRPWGIELMQLDDGYQQTQVPMRKGGEVGESWLTTNEKFPGGHKAIVDAMQSGGFTPGIWINATLTNKENSESIGCCIKDRDGELIKGDWIQYIMDCTPEMLKLHVEKCYRELRKQGYRYFKIDSIRHLLYDGLEEAVRRGLMTTEEARKRHRAYLQAARDGMGEEIFLLSCWGVLSSSIGICDAMRVATDANPGWGAFSMQVRETARWYFAHRILFTVDPDHVCVRAKLPWVRMMLSLVSLSGGIMMVSDPPQTYDEDRIELMRRTMPPLAAHAGEVGPVDYTTPACTYIPKTKSDEEASFAIAHQRKNDLDPMGSLWSIHMEQGGRDWCVIERCGVTPLEKTKIQLDNLCLDPSKTYYAFDFWRQQAWKISDGSLNLHELALGDCQVVALTEITDKKIELIGSDRHVSCDAVSVLSETITDTETETTYHLKLKGFAGLQVVYTFYLSEAESVKKEAICAQGIQIHSVSREGNLLKIAVVFDCDEAALEIQV